MTNFKNITHKQAGISLLEVLVTISLLSMVALSTTANTIFALNANKRTEVSNAAHNLAMSKVEEFAGIDVSTLDNGDDLTETSVTVTGLNITFKRVTDVTVNADSSRTVVVTVTCNDPRFNKVKSSYDTTFALLE